MNYQQFSCNKTFSSSPNFFSDEQNKHSENLYSFTPTIEGPSSFPKKQEDFIKDNLSNIEEVGNHSFNSGNFRDFLQSSAPKSHFMDDYMLLRQQNANSGNPPHMQFSCQYPQTYQYPHQSNAQNYEIRSDINPDPSFKKNGDIVAILDSSLSDQKNKVNFNELTIQPDLETRSVYNVTNEKFEGGPSKHGPYSLDMNQNQLLEYELQNDPLFEGDNITSHNILSPFNAFSNNSIPDQKQDKRPSLHLKGYSGDLGKFSTQPMLSVNLSSNQEERKKEDYVAGLLSHPNFSHSEQRTDHQPTIKGRTNFIDIFKKEPIYHYQSAVRKEEEKKEEQQKPKKALPPLFNKEDSPRQENQNYFDPKLIQRSFSPDLTESPIPRPDKQLVTSPRIIINGYEFSASQKNIFDLEQNVRKSIDLGSSNNSKNFKNNENTPSGNFFELPPMNNDNYNPQPFTLPETEEKPQPTVGYKIEDSMNYPHRQSLSKFATPHVETPLISPFWKMEYFEKGASLGRGKFSSVYIARDKRTKFIVALKVIQKQVLKETGAEKALAQEIKLQSFCDHPNILKLFGYFEEEEKIILVLEYATHGQLFSELKQQVFLSRRFDELKASSYIKQILYAIQYLHRNDIMHRDIKPENIMVSHGVLKLSDFGWAAFCPKDKRRETFCGTLDYVAPEVVEGHLYDSMVDIWSLGVLCYELCEGKPPFLHESTSETYLRILNCVMEIPPHFSAELRDLISLVFRKNPQERPSIDALIHHAWFQKSEPNLSDFRDESMLSRINCF